MLYIAEDEDACTVYVNLRSGYARNAKDHVNRIVYRVVLTSFPDDATFKVYTH